MVKWANFKSPRQAGICANLARYIFKKRTVIINEER